MYAINFLDLDQIYLIRRTLGTFILTYIWYFSTASLRFLSLFNFAIYRFCPFQTFFSLLNPILPTWILYKLTYYLKKLGFKTVVAL